MVSRSNIQFFIVSLLMLVCSISQAATQVDASVDRNPALMNESINLEIRVNDSVSQNAYDPSILAKDFRILGTSISSHTSIVNGKTTRITAFTTRLLPKREGKITIPSITVAGASSKPINLTVMPAGNTSGQSVQQQNVFMKTSVTDSDIWLNQQITYTVKLYLGAPLGSNASLTEPELEGAIIEQIGKDQEHDAIENGKRYRVIARSYSVTPQKSGELIIKSPIFEGNLVYRNGYNRTQTKTITRTAKDIKLTVNAIPSEYKGHWLPSEYLQLHEEINPTDKFVVGEPITRTITLTALGIQKDLLPELTINYPSSVKVYPDQAEIHSQMREQGLVSQRIQSSAIIPNQAGQITLPAIELNWWSTKFEKMETATIPSRVINVAPAASTNTTAVQQSNPLPVVTQSVQTDAQQIKHVNKHLPWGWNHLATLLSSLLGLSLLINFYFYLTNKVNTEQPINNLSASNKEKLAWLSLNKAVKKSDRQAIQQAYPKWVAALFQQPEVTSLHQANKVLQSSEISQQLDKMQAQAFSSGQAASWSTSELKIALEKARAEHLNQNKASFNLEKLNPA